jgi:hypothetical protein
MERRIIWSNLTILFFRLKKFIKGGLLMLESQFQAKLIKELKEMFPGCIVTKNDADYIQGIPDLTIFYKNKWATLECKKNSRANKQPNQEYYVERMNEMSFSRFICPENKEEVLDELQQAFKSCRSARIPWSK